MKIRIKGNTLRFRLDRNDIDCIQQQGYVMEETQIASGSIHFCIKLKEVEEPIVKLDPFAVHVQYPVKQLSEWTNSDENGLYCSIRNADGSELKVTIEKDYKCLTERGEDESANFENPLSRHNC